MHTTPTPRPSVRRRRLALLVAPATALVIGVGCGSEDPGKGETAVLGAEVERTPTATPLPRRIVAESTDRAAAVDPSDVVRIGGVRIVAESTDRVAWTPFDVDAAGNVGPDRPIRVNGGRTED